MRLDQNLSDKQQNKHLQLIYTLLMTILLIPGCSIKENTPVLESNIDGETAPGAYRITLWEGGGFTGITTGFNLFSDGRVTHWQRFRGQTDSVLWTEEGHAAKIDTLRIQLEESGSLAMQCNESGNMTAGITLETKDKAYLWTWIHTGRIGDIPKPLRIWHQKTLEFCQSLHKN